MSAEDTSAPLGHTRTIDSVAAKYDHEIRLVDSTEDNGAPRPSVQHHASFRHMVRNPTQTSIRQELARRKYAKYSQDKYDFSPDILAELRASSSQPASSVSEQPVIPPKTDPTTEAADFAVQPSSEPASPIVTKASKRSHRRTQSEIDILYENQRGSWFCGIPLYSHSSLLNFDPSAWVNKEFKDSPVNITNAQVPDPSWVWDWKSWYVDMAGDVDEQGWQYSFAFGNRFSWHGNHPWLFSFARRRRWLRRRVKRTVPLAQVGTEGDITAAHHLNTDYFTIHSKHQGRDSDVFSNPDAQPVRPASFDSDLCGQDEKPDAILDIPSLEKAIKRASLDREKIEAMRQFIDQGGDELFYLADKIKELMSTFVFQNSRRQVLEYLQETAKKAQSHRESHEHDHRPESKAEAGHIDALLKAADAAKRQISGLEYWSDRKHILQTVDDSDEVEDEDFRPEEDVIGDIKGISEKAETGGDILVDRRLKNKGKEREDREPDVSFNGDGLPDPTKRDADMILIPD